MPSQAVAAEEAALGMIWARPQLRASPMRCAGRRALRQRLRLSRYRSSRALALRSITSAVLHVQSDLLVPSDTTVVCWTGETISSANDGGVLAG